MAQYIYRFGWHILDGKLCLGGAACPIPMQHRYTLQYRSFIKQKFLSRVIYMAEMQR
uniref:Uncharacterized protein n=1 Tax=Anguilla anguilla TaxID=7936 RepID=A0A0E9XXU2_ANGAN